MADDRYDCLKLENQLCFPLYVCSKEIVRKYRPMLDELDLTYTQYITMMALWEYGSSSVNDLGRKLYLDSGTLTPLLKNLEAKGYVKKDRSKDDERSVTVSLTPEGVKLRDRAMSIPGMMASCISLPQDKAIQLYNILYEVLEQLNKENEKN